MRFTDDKLKLSVWYKNKGILVNLCTYLVALTLTYTFSSDVLFFLFAMTFAQGLTGSDWLTTDPHLSKSLTPNCTASPEPSDWHWAKGESTTTIPKLPLSSSFKISYSFTSPESADYTFGNEVNRAARYVVEAGSYAKVGEVHFRRWIWPVNCVTCFGDLFLPPLSRENMPQRTNRWCRLLRCIKYGTFGDHLWLHVCTSSKCVLVGKLRCIQVFGTIYSLSN